MLGRIFNTFGRLSKNIQPVVNNYVKPASFLINNNIPTISICKFSYLAQPNNPSILQSAIKLRTLPNDLISTRTVTKYSYRKGKRKSVKTVLKRFYRLHWGGWIRTICGRHKRLWRKSPPRKRRLRQHVFCNATQNKLLDKMVGNYWRQPKYYVDDPYNPYHVRDEFSITSKKPRPYFPPEEQN